MFIRKPTDMPTVKELQAMARERGLKGYSGKRKSELENMLGLVQSAAQSLVGAVGSVVDAVVPAAPERTAAELNAKYGVETLAQMDDEPRKPTRLAPGFVPLDRDTTEDEDDALLALASSNKDRNKSLVQQVIDSTVGAVVDAVVPPKKNRSVVIAADGKERQSEAEYKASLRRLRMPKVEEVAVAVPLEESRKADDDEERAWKEYEAYMDAARANGYGEYEILSVHHLSATKRAQMRGWLNYHSAKQLFADYADVVVTRPAADFAPDEFYDLPMYSVNPQGLYWLDYDTAEFREYAPGRIAAALVRYMGKIVYFSSH